MRIAAVVSCVLCGMVSLGAVLDADLIRTSGEPAVADGMFYGYRTVAQGAGDLALSNAYDLARSEGVPLVVIWSNEDCHFCDEFISDLNLRKREVKAWLSETRAVFAFFKDESGDYAPTRGHVPRACYDAWNFTAAVCGSQPPWPLVGFHYVRPDGTAVKFGHGTVTGKSFAWLKRQYETWAQENHIYYCGGGFTDVGTEFNRYEAEATTRFVDVRLVRDKTALASVWTNRLEAVWPAGAGETVCSQVVWTVGTSDLTVRVPLVRKAGADFPVGRSISLGLYSEDDGVDPVAVNHIACVELENAAANPKWIGEDFGFGEWTMDLDAAKAKVAATNVEAFTVVSLQGSKWCPDCANVDRNFLDLTNAAGENAFCAWAKARHVALVTIDIPNFTGPNATDYASPSLLDRTPFVTTLARAKEYPQSGADASLLQPLVRSGLGYLSRKSVDEETAAFYFNRNHDLAARNTVEGGFHRPEDGNANRTGVPIFVLLRKDGSVAARLTRMASVSPMAADRGNFENYIRRFEEMMAIAADGDGHADATEIENNHPSGTPCTVASAGGDVTNELCNADFQDTFEIVGDLRGTRQTVRVTGTDDAVVNVALVSRGDSGLLETLASTNAALSAAPALTCDFRKTGRYFVQVKGADITSPAFDLASAEDLHFHRYRLTTSAEPIPPVPGTVAFAASNRRIIEYAGTGVVRVVRTDGSFGASRVKVVCDNPPADDRFVWTDTVLAWDDGEDGEREVRIPIVPNKTVNPEVSFTLRLEADDPCAAAVSTNVCEVTVFDTDLPCLGSTSYALAPDRFFETAIPFEVYNVSNAASLAISVKKGSGTVPPGLRFVVDKATDAISLVGVPSTAGTWSFTVTLTEKRKNKSVSGIETQITLTVADRSVDNPYLALARPNVRLPLSDGDIVAGMLSFAVTSRGGISARYAGTEGEAISFAGNWQAFDPVLKTVSAVLKTGDATLTVAMNEDGRVELALDPGDGSSFAAESSWPTPGEPFTGYQGRYNVTFPYAGGVLPVTEPCGTGFLQLDLTAESAVAAGLVRYAGQLPDGTPVSGSEYLLRDGLLPDVALLPVFRRVSDSCFSAALEIGANGASKWDGNGYDERRGILSREIVNSAEGTRASYLHRDSAWEYRTFHEACGSYYVPGVSPKALCDKFHSGRTAFALTLSSEMAGPVAPHGQVSAVTSKADADVGVETIELVPEIDGLSFSYDSRLGVFCGEALLTFADGRTAVGSYRGAAIPGWTNCGCGLENPPIRPFASGTLKFRDWVDGHAVVRSFPVDLDADVTRVTLASAASAASSGGTAGSAVGAVRFAGETQTEEDGYGVDFSFLSNRIVGDCLTADDQAIIGQYDAVTKLGVTSVSGLPTGTKLVKTTADGVTTYSVEGTFTKAGTFTAKVSVACEDPGTGKIAKTTVQRKLTVDAADAIQLTASVRDAESAPKCRVSGGGVCKPGSIVRFSATAASKFAFAGWFDANGLPLAAEGADYRASSVSETVSALTVRDRYAAFVPSADDGLAIDGLDGAEYALDPNGATVFREVFDVASGSLPTLTFKGLPTGVTCAPSGDFPGEYALSYDPAKVRTAPKPGRYRVTLTAKNASKTMSSAAFLIAVRNLTSEFVRIEDDYGVLTPDVPIESISLSNAVDFAEGWTLKVSGLPAGLKYDDRTTPRMITGTPTKPGEYTLTFTAKQGRTTATATAFVTVKQRPEITAEVIGEAARAAGCKVTGTGNFKRDTRVTLKAVAAKGYVFAGWEGDVTDALEGIDRLNPTLVCSLQKDTNAVCAAFIRVSEGGLSFDWEGDVELAVGQDIAEAGFGGLVRDNLNAKAWPTVSVSGLPTGIKFDSKTLLLSGAATKAAVSFVSVSAKDAAGYAFSATVRFVVGGAKIDEPDEIGPAWGVDFSAFDNLVLGKPFEWVVESWMAISASGLPTGLTMVRNCACSGGEPCDAVCGTPTKAGKFTITFTMKDPASGKTLTTKKTVVVHGAPSGYVGAGAAAGGAVTGAGVYGAGATVRLVAKPDRDFVFAGWYETDGRRCAIEGFDYRTPTLSYLANGARTFVPKFISKAEDLADDYDLWGHDACSDATDWRVEDQSEYLLWADSASLPKLTVKGLPAGTEFKGLYLDGEDPFPVYRFRVKDKSKLKPGRYPVTVTAENVSKVKRTWTFIALVPNLTSDVIQGLDTSDEGYQLWLGVGSYATPEMAEQTGWYDFRSPSAGVTVYGSWSWSSIKVDGLPTGLKFGRDPAASLCCGAMEAMKVYGIPTKLGTSTVAVTLTSGKQVEKATAFVTVNARPAWAVGTFGGYQVAEGGPGEVVTLTAAADGKVSGKIGTSPFTATLDRYFVDYAGCCGFVGEIDRFERFLVIEEDPDTPGIGRATIYHSTLQWGDYSYWWRDSYAWQDGSCLAWQNPWDVSAFDLTGVSGDAGTLSNGLKVRLDGKGNAVVAGGVNGVPFSASFPVRLVEFVDCGEGAARWEFEVAVSIPVADYSRLVRISSTRDQNKVVSLVITEK